ncbi:MAG: sulfite exporter TauE/SafE family protein [Oscillospiraceae bacterium]|nr:sulfite exporter TauE/SafE family protein [Oscillospiraceae bacterium]
MVCLIASTLGAIAGFGGGVIIKPVLDAIGILPAATVSFLSGCTVLAMSVSSLIRTRNNGVRLQVKTSTPLAIGAVLGGLAGKWLFQLVLTMSDQEETLGGIQAICLTIINIGVFIYVCVKDRLPSKHVESSLAAVLIGLVLGLISTFLGIGGGPINIAVLFFFFSMDAKEAAKNSIYIIMFSQISSIVTALATNTVPAFSWPDLIFMACGGVGGAILGAAISKHLDSKMVEKLLRVLMIIVTGIAAYNVVQFFLL